MKPPFYVVLGPPRGGTSSVAMVLEKLGAPGRLAPRPHIDGLAGYPSYEDPVLSTMVALVRGQSPWAHLKTLRGYIALRRRQDPNKILSCKHPWLCDVGGCPLKTASYFREANVHWVRVVRPFEDTVASIQAKYRREKATRLEEARRFHACLDRLAEVCPPILEVSFSGLLSDPRATAQEIADVLELPGSVEEAARLVHRGRPEPNALRARPHDWKQQA